MRNHLLAAVFFVAVQAAFGQLDDNTLSVTSSRALSTRTDDFQILVSAETPSDFTLDAVIRALEGTGVNASHFIDVTNPRIGRFTTVLTGPEISAWTFRITLPFSKLNEALNSLARVRAPGGVTVYYSVQSAPAVPAPCPWQTLLGDAQIQAQKLASTVGLKVGPILALSDQKDSPQLVSRVAIFSLFNPLSTISFGGFFVGAPPETCSLTVQFKLLR